MPKISVCVPAYNAGHFLRPAIASVLTQSFQDLELIVVDDCSTESPAATIAQFDDERLCFQRNPRNLGLAGNWNRCLELAQGEYVTIFHQDDIMLPDNLALKIALLDRCRSVGFVYSDIQTISEAGQVIGGHWIAQPETDLILPGQAIFEMVADTGNPISCPSVVARKECYERLGGFETRLPFATDLEMWLRLATYYDVGYLAQPLIAQRVHPEQETARFQGTGRDYLDVLRALDSVFSQDIPVTHRRYARRAYRNLRLQATRMARWKLRQGRVANGLFYLAVAAACLFRSRL